MFYIFFYEWCGFSQNALQLAKSSKVHHTKMNMQKFGGKENVIAILKKKGLMKKTSKHNTAPIIFQNDSFIGGYTEFKKMLEKNKNK